MNKFKEWLYNKFLPAYCRDDLMDTNARLLRALAELKQENQRLNAYIAGLETAMRHQRRIGISIHNEANKNEVSE